MAAAAISDETSPPLSPWIRQPESQSVAEGVRRIGPSVARGRETAPARRRRVRPVARTGPRPL